MQSTTRLTLHKSFASIFHPCFFVIYDHPINVPLPLTTPTYNVFSLVKSSESMSESEQLHTYPFPNPKQSTEMKLGLIKLA